MVLEVSKPKAPTVLTPCPASAPFSDTTLKTSSHSRWLIVVGTDRVSPLTVIAGGAARTSSDFTLIFTSVFVTGRSNVMLNSSGTLSVTVIGTRIVCIPERSVIDPGSIIKITGPTVGNDSTVRNTSFGSAACVRVEAAGTPAMRNPEAMSDGTEIISLNVTRMLVRFPDLIVLETVSYHSPATAEATRGGFWSEVNTWT